MVGDYPVHEFIYLLEGSIILTVEGEEHVFEAGEAFFIPQGLRCSPPCPPAFPELAALLSVLTLTANPVVVWFASLRCSWRQPTALKKCYIVYTPVEPEASAKL